MSSPVRWIPRRWNGSVSSIKGLGPRESRRSGKAKARSIFAAKKLTESEYQNWIGARNQAKRTGKEVLSNIRTSRLQIKLEDPLAPETEYGPSFSSRKCFLS
mmetsp:Transcript_3277/g.15510  ORF Transcript_3277/g.15510 Transcript_3277/m.15510 type:complete len:102 (+) Transcript_3277:293-598(+)